MSSKDDQKICMMVANKLAGRGIRSPCSVSVTSRNGEVTLSGTVVQAHQKNAATNVAAGVEGVKRVYDHLVVKAAAKRSNDPNGQWTVRPTKSMIESDAAAAAVAKAEAIEASPGPAELDKNP